MSRGSIWSILGLRPTRDQAEIRRAYARKLKQTNPEDDAEGFQALRQAYDQALRASRLNAAPERQEFIEPELAEARADSFEDAEPARPVSRGPLPRPARPPIEPRQEPSHVFDPIDEEAHATLCNLLLGKLRDPRSTPRELIDGLEALLASPALDSLAIHQRTESWLADTLCRTGAGADLLLDRAIEAFRWEHALPSTGMAAAVVARRDGLAQIRARVGRGKPLRRAYDTLRRPPYGSERSKAALLPGLAGDVRKLLLEIEATCPQFIAQLDREAVAWWRKYLASPRYGALGFWGAVAASVLFSVAYLRRDATPFGPWQIIGHALAFAFPVVFVQLLWLFGIARPRAAWRAHRSHDAPLLARLGWAPAFALLLVAAVLIPPSTIATAALSLAAACLLAWSLITGEPDESPGDGPPWAMPRSPSAFTLFFFLVQPLWRRGTQLPWQVRTLFAYTYLAVFYLAVSGLFPPPAWNQLGVPLLAAGAAFAMSAQTLSEAWTRETSPSARIAILGLGGLGVTLAACLLWASALAPRLAGPAAALTAILVLAHKPIGEQLGRVGAMTRDIAMRFGWIAWTFALAADGLRQANGALFYNGLWVLSGVAIAVIGALRTEGLRHRSAGRPVRRST